MKKIVSVFLFVTVLICMIIPATAYDAPKKTQAIKGTPAIDGVIDDSWKDAHEIEANLVNQVFFGEVQTATTAKVKTMWDESYFYILAIVSDSAVHAAATEGTADEDKDSIEFGFDEGNDMEGTGNVAAGNPLAGVFRIGTNDSFISGFGDKLVNDKDKIKGKCVIAAPGYIVEMAIPWTNPAVEGRIIGMEVQVNDNFEGIKRNAAVTWNLVDCMGWSDTSAHGRITLVAAPEKAVDVPEEVPSAAAVVEEVKTTDTKTNPETGDNSIIFITLIILAACSAFVITKKSSIKK